MTDKERDQIIRALTDYCNASDECPHCPISNELNINNCAACDWEDMTDEQLAIAARAAGIDKDPQPDMVNKPNGMTREEKIQALADFCTNSTSCSDCLVRIPSSPDGSGCKQWREWTDEEIDVALAKLPDAAVQAADMVNKPNHYQLPGGMECWDVLVACFGEEETKIWAKINAFTYLFRHKRKNGEEDIRKALVNLQKYFELGGEAE